MPVAIGAQLTTLVFFFVAYMNTKAKENISFILKDVTQAASSLADERIKNYQQIKHLETMVKKLEEKLAVQRQRKQSILTESSLEEYLTSTLTKQ